ncbi:MAG: acetoin dehydrogenase dihydrolipoyllysine-residue acetyltransferase subunit [Sphaerobacter sp.]|nr:acetoin dehydrogenase dihydrolipoyllysine-residue acetyltransferase subunit [Sphaerobacter sp.]
MTTDTSIVKLTMPKWGLSMTEGRLVSWLVEEGSVIRPGDEVAEVETEKINGVVEAPAEGILRRRVAEVGQVIPVGGMLGVIADATTPEEQIERLIAEFRATFVPPAETGETGPAPEHVAVGDRTIRYLKHGEDGPAVILIHGFGGDLNTWLFNHEALADGRTVYALDLPGHGGSSKDVGDGTLDTLAATVVGFMDALGIARAHLVGHSMGGATAMAAAAAHPARVSSLTLIASAGLGPEINREYIEGFIAASSRRQMTPVLAMLFADPALVTRQLVEDTLRAKRIDGVDQALRTLADRLFPGGRQAIDLAPALAATSLPVLGIWGREDRVIPADHARALPERAQVTIIEGKGHSVQMEAAGEVTRLIDRFLAEADA